RGALRESPRRRGPPATPANGIGEDTGSIARTGRSLRSVSGQRSQRVAGGYCVHGERMPFSMGTATGGAGGYEDGGKAETGCLAGRGSDGRGDRSCANGGKEDRVPVHGAGVAVCGEGPRARWDRAG